MDLSASSHFAAIPAYLRMAVEVMACLALGWMAARALWLIVDPAGAVSQVTDLPAQRTAHAPGRSVVDTGILLQPGLFSAGLPAPATPDVVQDTTLALTLRGVRASSDGAAATALIAGPDGGVASYSPGDIILAGVALERVDGARALIRRGGQLEALTLTGTSNSLSVVSRPGDARQPIRQPNQTSRAPIAQSPAATPSLSNPPRPSMLASLTFQPAATPSGARGYRIGAGAPSALSATGLQVGDIITHIDGTSTDALDPAALMAAVNTRSNVSVDLDRAGTPITLTLSLTEDVF